MDRPRICRDYFVHIIAKDEVLLLSEREHFLLRAPIYSSLIPLLDGRNTVDEITALLRGTADERAIFLALSFLKEKQLLDSPLTPIDRRDAEFWNSLAFREKLPAFPVSVVTFGDVETGNLYNLLSDCGIPVEQNAPLTIVVTSDYLRPEMDQWNRSMLSENRPWIPVKSSGMEPWIGPLFRPYIGPCWECMAQRLKWNRSLEIAIQRKLKTDYPLLPSYRNPSTELVTFEILIAQIAKHFAGTGDSQLAEGLSVLRIQEHVLETHFVVRRPQCEACSKSRGTMIERKPVPLGSRIAISTCETGHRNCSPDETLRRYSKHVSPFTGVVRELRRLPPEAIPTPVYIAGHARKESSPDIHALLEERHLTNSGKGTTDAAAKASALGEAVERYSAFFQGNEPRIVSTYRELGNCAIHPYALLNFSEAQYRDRSDWNASAQRAAGEKPAVHRRCHVPKPFSEETRIEWTPVWSLTRQEFRYVPTAYCYFGYPQNREIAFCESDSNGNAAGNSIEEAILQGFLELVERDAVAIWWYNKVQRPALEIDFVNEPFFGRLKEFYRLHGGEFWVLDLTNDLEIPVFAALGRSFRSNQEKLSFGFGAHLEARTAIFRALTEMSQTQPYLLSGKEERENPMFREWWKRITTKSLPFLLPDRTLTQKKISEYPGISSEDLREEVNFCVETARKYNLETLVLDQTQPDIAMPVVKVMVPGLRHMLPRFGPGRLYDVPVKEGWLQHPVQESQLNDVPFLL